MSPSFRQGGLNCRDDFVIWRAAQDKIEKKRLSSSSSAKAIKSPSRRRISTMATITPGCSTPPRGDPRSHSNKICDREVGAIGGMKGTAPSKSPTSPTKKGDLEGRAWW